MRILSFPNFSKNRTEVNARDWSQQEIADFYRAHRLLVENGAGIGIERGISDIGEPWMVFFDASTQDVFMHVARIDDRCILVCDQLNIHLKAANIGALISDFENSVRHHLAIRTERNSNIVIHPAARIIMSISMVFLLFKLDNSPAYAKGVSDAKVHSGPEAGTTRAVNTDYTPTHRAQSAFARMLENADTPASVAVLAGIILAGELAASSHSAGPEYTHLEVAAVLHEIAPVSETAAEVSTRMFTTGENRNALRAEKVAGASDTAHQEIVAVAPVVYTASQDKDLVVSLAKLLMGQIYATANHDLADKLLAADQEAVQVAMMTANQNAQAPVATGGTILVPEQSNQALQTVAGLLGLTTGAIAAEQAITAPGPKDTVKVVTTNKITDISIASLDTVDDHAGFYMRTTLSDSKLRDALEHFMSAMGDYQIEYLGGKLLIEQSSMPGLADKDIGLWTNIMADGSSISVVGQASLVDDIAGFLV